MTDIMISLFSNYRWALVILLFNLIVIYASPYYPQLIDNPELSQAVKNVIEWILWFLFALMMRMPRWIAKDNDIGGAWELFKRTLKESKQPDLQ